MASAQHLKKAAPLAIIAMRPYSSVRIIRSPYKDSEDRQSLRPGVTESTLSIRDSDMAEQHPKASFDPKITSPEDHYKSAGKGCKGENPLEASGANQPFSKPLGDEKTSNGNGPGKETAKTGKPSRATSPPKKGKPSSS